MTHAPELTMYSEAIPLGEAVKNGRVGAKFPALLIEAGWSLNGRYYSEAMLKEYGPKAFAAGSLMRADHPTSDEREAKPEGSIRDVVSVLSSTAKWSDKHKGLVAEVEIMPQHEGLLNERYARVIGLSIRAYGTAEYGDAEGRTGTIMTSLGEGSTVDWVTHPGAGGRVIEALESAPTFREAHGLSANTLHIALSKAVELTHGRDDCRYWVYVCDYDDTWLIFDVYGDREDTGRFKQDYTIDGAGTVTLTGDPVQVNTQTIYVPVVVTDVAETESADPTDPTETATPPVAESTTVPPPATGPAVTPSPVAPATDTAPIMKEAVVTTPEPTGAPPAGAASAPAPISEGVGTKVLNTLEEAKAYASEMERQAAEARAIAESKADDRAARIRAEADALTARNETARFRAMEGARSTTQVALNESGLPECVFSRVIATVTGHEGRAIPLTESYAVDGDKLKVKVAEAVRDWQVLVGQILESAGLDGRVKGLGGSGQPEGLTPAQAQESMKARFIRQGMSADAAAVAAAGRG